MPRKRPLTESRRNQLANQLEATRKSLRATRHELNRHYKANHTLVRQADAIHELFLALIERASDDRSSRVG